MRQVINTAIEASIIIMFLASMYILLIAFA